VDHLPWTRGVAAARRDRAAMTGGVEGNGFRRFASNMRGP
jgi:hypothetical protein